jgi:hypothetical protein
MVPSVVMNKVSEPIRQCLPLYFDGAPRPVWEALAQTPRFVLRQVLGLLKMRDPNKNFKHTEHRRAVDVDEVMKGKG